MIYEHGLIIEEIPHQMPTQVWSSYSEESFMKTVWKIEFQSKSDSTEYDIMTLQGCKDYVAHDLRSCHFYTYQDFKDDPEHFKTDWRLKKEAVRLGWLNEEEGEE